MDEDVTTRAVKRPVTCSECGLSVQRKRVCVIDDKPVCNHCLYGDAEPFKIFPIGEVRTTESEEFCWIDLVPSQERFMYKLEEEEILTIVYYLHLVTEVESVFRRGMKMKGDGKVVGVFASRTPRRTSRIAVQDVRLHEIKGTSLYVEGLDAKNGSPVLDIKMGRNKSGYRV